MKIRQATLGDESRMAFVHVSSWRETYKGIVKDSFLEKLHIGNREAMWKRLLEQNQGNAFIFVVEDDKGDIVGFANGGENRTEKHPYQGEIYTLYLLAAHQGKGIGKALFLRFTSALYSYGYKSMMLWVLEENKTRGFYEKFTPKLVDRDFIESLGAFEVAYGWEDISFLMEEINH